MVMSLHPLKKEGAVRGHTPAPLTPVPAETRLGPCTPAGGSTGLGLGAGAEPREGGDQAVGSSLSACQWGSP